MKENERLFRFHSQIPEKWEIQFPTFSFQSSEISENFAFLHIFQIYEQQSGSLLTSNSYLASIHRFEPVFSLSLTSKSLLGLTQNPNRTRLEYDRARTEPEQDLFGI